MRVETINNKNPRGGRIKRNGALNMLHTILFGPRWSHGRRHDLPGRHLKSGDQGLRPMPNVFKFHALDPARLQRPCRIRPFIGLHTGLLIRAHDMHTVFMQGLGCVIEVAYRPDVGVKLLRVRRPVMMEPIPRLMRFYIRVLLKNARCCGGKWWGQGHA